MAITKITRTNDAQFYADLKSALEPFFAEVTNGGASNNNYVYCKNDNGITAMIVRPDGSSSYSPAVVYYTGDSAGNSVAPSYIGNTNSARMNEIYKCSSGIMFGVIYSGSTQYQPILGVTKDNNDNTVIITPTENFSQNVNGSVNDKKSASFDAINKNSIRKNGYDQFFSQSTIYPSTQLTNIPVNDVGAYCPNAFKFDCKEDSIASHQIRKITLDGVDYLANGFWCIKDV